MLWSNFVRLFNHLIAFTSVHTVSHYILHAQRVCGQIYNENVFFLDLLVQEPFFHNNHWFQLLSIKTRLEHLIVLNLNHIACLSTLPSSLLVANSRISKLRASMKRFLLLLTKSPNKRRFCSSVHFLSFFRFRFLAYWDNYRKFAGFDVFKTLKRYYSGHSK